MAIVQRLGAGADLDDILEHIAVAVIDVIGFGAVAVNVVTGTGDLEVRTVVGPPELAGLRGGVLSHERWLDLLDASEPWGQLRFCRSPTLDESVPHADPWPDRFPIPSAADQDPAVEPWQPEFALLVPLWRGLRELLGVISVDLPQSGLTPDFQQRALLELFGTQAAAAISRVHALDLVTDKAGLYRAAFTASPAPTLVLDAHFRVADVNAAYLDMADAVVAEVVGQQLVDLVALPDVGLMESVINALDREGAHDTAVIAEECALRHPRGHGWDRWVQVQARRVDGIATGPNYVCLLTDRTAVRHSMEAMRRRAEYDGLTGLSLRAVGMKQLAERCAPPPVTADDPDAQLPRPAQAVLYCDLDNFKQVNDAEGHRAGDDALVAVAQCLRDIAGEADVVCRWGGDEFVLIVGRPTLRHIVDMAHLLVTAVQALAATARPEEPLSKLNLSIGIAEFVPPAEPAVVLEVADAALYRAKTDAHQRVHVHMQ